MRPYKTIKESKVYFPFQHLKRDNKNMLDTWSDTIESLKMKEAENELPMLC